jgi:hypothetical protein
VDAAAAGFDADGMLKVEHLVIKQVLDCAARRVWAVEDARDYNGIVSCVVVTEHATSVVGAPGESGPAEKAMEETCVEGLEDLVEIVVMAYGRRETFAAAGLADVLGLFGDGLGGDVAAIAVGVEAGDGFSVELGQEDVGDGVMDVLGRRFEDVGESDMEAAFAKTDGGVERGEAAEADVQRRHGGAGAEFAVLLFEDCNQGSGRRDFFCARFFGP